MWAGEIGMRYSGSRLWFSALEYIVGFPDNNENSGRQPHIESEEVWIWSLVREAREQTWHENARPWPDFDPTFSPMNYEAEGVEDKITFST